MIAQGIRTQTAVTTQRGRRATAVRASFAQRQCAMSRTDVTTPTWRISRVRQNRVAAARDRRTFR